MKFRRKWPAGRRRKVSRGRRLFATPKSTIRSVIISIHSRRASSGRTDFYFLKKSFDVLLCESNLPANVARCSRPSNSVLQQQEKKVAINQFVNVSPATFTNQRALKLPKMRVESVSSTGFQQIFNCQNAVKHFMEAEEADFGQEIDLFRFFF